MGPWIAAPVSLLLLGLGVYCHRNWFSIFQEDPPGMGVVFTKISHHSQHLLERLLIAQNPGPSDAA